MGRKVNIGNERRVVTISLQTGRDVLHILCLARALCGETNQFTTSINDALSLCHTGFGIVSISGCHRLDADRIVATDFDVAHMGYG